MLSEKLHKELNNQMNYEFQSANVYLAIAGWLASKSYDGFSNFFIVQAEEERFHAMKFFNYINDRGKKAEITGYPDPSNQFDSVLDCFEKAYKHEQSVTKRIYHLSDIAMDEREHATIQFLKWFIDEQVEEEALFDSIIEKLKRIEQDSNAFFMLEEEFAKRSFTPPSEG